MSHQQPTEGEAETGEKNVLPIVMTRSQREEDRQTDPPIRRHAEGHGTEEGTGDTDMTGDQAPKEEGHEEARDLP